MVTYLGSVKRGRESLTKLAMLPRAFQNQTQFPLYTFATAPSIHHISNCDHRIYKNTERFLSPAPKPSVPWTPPHSVEFVCIFTIESLTSLSVTKSCCQEENHSSAVTYGKKRREDVTRRTETAKKKGDMIALPPPSSRADGGCRILSYFLSSPENTLSGLHNRGNHTWGLSESGIREGSFFISAANGPRFSAPDGCRMAGAGRRHAAAGSPG